MDMNGLFLDWCPSSMLAAGTAATDSGKVDPIATSMIVAGVVFLGMLMTYSIRARIARRAAETPSARERIEELKRQAEGRLDPERERALLLDESQRYAATLDNKARRLEMLLSEADEAIDQLTTLREQVRTLVERRRPDAASRAKKQATTPSTSATDEATAVATETAAPQQASEALASARKAVESLAPEIDTLVAPRDPLTATVYEMADAGQTAVDIARALDEHTGKVELILALRSA